MEGATNVRERSGKYSNLVEFVLSWSLEDIFDQNLYIHKVKKIPDSFETLAEYFSSYVYPLLEETRAGLCSSIEIIAWAPFAPVVSYDKAKSNQSQVFDDETLLYDVTVDNWKNKSNGSGKEPYNTFPGDIIAFAQHCPQNTEDLKAVAQTWVLGCVTKVSKDKRDDVTGDGTSATTFQIRTSKDIGLLGDNCNSFFAIFLTNINTNRRIWDVLHMCGNPKIIARVMQKTTEAEECHCLHSMNNDWLAENLHVDLNPSQYEAVLASIQRAKCMHKLHVDLVWGPPGTGKTKTLSVLLYYLLNLNCRALVCAPTNVAIIEVAKRVLELMKNSCSIDSSGFLGDVLLLGNKQKFKVESQLEDIWFEYRVKRLSECFDPLTGWTNRFTLLLSFLEDCVSQYNDSETIVEVDTSEEINSFVTFARNHFIAAAKPVRQCISIFQTHVSKNYIGQPNLDNMKYLDGLLHSFEEILFQDNIDSADLLRLFSPNSVSEDAELALLETLRRKCISILTTLHHSLSECDLPISVNKQSLEELCLRMASLVFCTASSAYKLHSMPIVSFNVMVVDEAAQLKECESIIPLQLPGLRHVVLFGDDCQLPAALNSKICCEAGFGRSLFRRLSLLGWSKHLLNVQYRMHPSISAFPNEEFYFNQILDAPNVKSKSYERHYLQGPMYGPYSFINVSGGDEELDADGFSRKNLVEAAVVAQILKNLYKAQRDSTQKLAVGIVSPYAAQVVAIEEMLGRRYEGLKNFRVKVKSIDGLQGGEEDIIIISTVRSNNLGSLGFIADDKRTNVALTRARYCLWVLGHANTLTRSDSIWIRLIHNAKERCCFFNADEDKSLAHAIKEVKEEIDPLENLLNKDSALFRSSRWKVLFSDNFVKTFSKLPSKRVKKCVINLLVKLSNGWRPKKVKTDPVSESTIKVVKHYKVEGRYVICTNDIQKQTAYMQVLKVWDIVLVEDVAKWVKRLDNIYGAFTDDFLTRCKEISLEGELEVPKMWSTSSEIIRFKSNDRAESTIASDGDLDGSSYAENVNVSDSLLLMKFYSLSVGIVSHLLSDSDGRALDLPFEVTDEELQIILHQKSSFILGRSGTGKTTVLTMKLFQKEQLHHMAFEGLCPCRDAPLMSASLDKSERTRSVLRQLFVTVSPKLCHAIKQHVSDLKRFARNEESSVANDPIDDIDDGDQFRGIPDSFVNMAPESYPLIITFDKFLTMLDGTIGRSYFERLHDSDGGTTVSRSAMRLIKLKEVKYDKFSLSYWPHFNSQLTKKLDASRVFTEIISSIKGGLQVGESLDGKLSLEDYLQLSKGRTSTVSCKEREAIYHIFLSYEKMKGGRGEFDLADLVNDLHLRLARERYGGDIMDFVYIDEVQDLTMRQIALFKYICRNVDEGFVFSGDTAQTIARGIDFRFQDVRYLFYKEFLMCKNNERNNNSHDKEQISPLFHLNQNFRTHAGILKLGQSIIELIYHFFPRSIDVLPPETSRVVGEPPILLESGSDENAMVTIFGKTGNVDGNTVGFGAEQVILVRDDFVRKEISDYVGKHAIILTIVECKGLEFQDVLLYNFFESSPLKNRWRVVYEFMKKQNMLDSTLPQSFPDFDSGKHNVLCSELKQLYVAVTRTRQRLWICENKNDVSKPMFDYWKKKCGVQVQQLDDSLAQSMQVASSPDEWKSRGKKLLEMHNYEAANMCFERAGDEHWKNYSKAAGLKATADRTYHVNVEEAFRILRQAAELFESINEYRKAAECYYELEEFDKAAKMHLDKFGEPELERAGECFSAAGNYELAAKVYAKGNFFIECLSSCTQGNLLDLGLQYVQCWENQAIFYQFPDDKRKEIEMTKQAFLETCAHRRYEEKDKKAMMKFVKAFSCEESMRVFLSNLGCFDELLVLEEERGNFSIAAGLAMERGELLLAADLLEKSGVFEESCDLLMQYSFAICLWDRGRKGRDLEHYRKKEELLLKAKACAYNTKSHLYYKTVCVDIMILLNRSHSLSKLEQLLVMSGHHENLIGEFLCTRKILDTMLEYDASKYELGSDHIDDLAAHSLHCISTNRVTVEALLYFCDSWRDFVLEIFRYLDAVEANEKNDFAEYGELCLYYLGVCALDLSVGSVYVCLYPYAEWMKFVDKIFLHQFGKVFIIDKQQLVDAARKHWWEEIVTTSSKFSNIISAFEKNPTKCYLSALWKVKACISLYDMIQLILFSVKGVGERIGESLQKQTVKLMPSCTDPLFEIFFPLDWKRSVSKDIIRLRDTATSTSLLGEFIGQVTLSRHDHKLTYQEHGIVAMVLLGSPIGRNGFLEMILGALDTDSPWKTLFETLKSMMSNETMRSNVSDACRLRNSLRDFLKFNRRSGVCVCPRFFLYLVDRLMISLLEIQGTLVMTRSSIIEWLIFRKWNTNVRTDLVTCRESSEFVKETYQFLATMVHMLAIKDVIVEWEARAGSDEKIFPVFLLRLLVFMCLIQLNSGICWDLFEEVMKRTDVTSELPPGFWNVLRRSRRDGFMNNVAKALKEIEDPLVVVSTGKIPSKFSCKDAISLEIVNLTKENLLEILYPVDVKNVHATDEGLFPPSTSKGCTALNDGEVWEFFNALELIDNEEDKHYKQSFVSRVQKLKLQVDKICELMTTAITTASGNGNCTDEFQKYVEEADSLLHELQLLSVALNASDQQVKDAMLLIKDSSRRVLLGKPIFEHFFGPAIPSKGMAIEPMVHEDKGGDDVSSKLDDVSNDLNVVDQKDVGNEKNKGKANKKSKHHKKNKGRK